MTEQKIRLEKDVLEKLKLYALKVGAIRGKPTTWADLLRNSANLIAAGPFPVEKYAKRMDSPAPDPRPAGDTSPTSE